MKILVLSSTPWNTNNSFGNSYSNIFDGMEEFTFANIYCKYGTVNDAKVKKSFQITEKSLIRNLLHKDKPSGREVNLAEAQNATDTEPTLYNTARKNRFQIYHWARDLIWKIGRWKSKELLQFIDEFKPDLLFVPIYYVAHMNDILRYIKKYTGLPMIGYISDDCYTLRQVHVSPLYWIDRLIKRRKVKASIEQCELLYVISQIQKDEYEKIFTPPVKILTKCADFKEEAPACKEPDDTVKLIYAGNLSKGRQKSLALLSAAVERLNNEGFSVCFDIYSGTPLTEKAKCSLSRVGSKLHKPVSYKEIQLIQQEADVLVHAEGLSLKDRCEVHQSFSTKLVDFFEMGKCIFAIGTYDMGFAKHLIDNDAAVVANGKEDDVYIKLKALLEQKEQIVAYGKKAYACGKEHHEKTKIQKMLAEDIKKVVDKHHEGITN